VRTYPADGMRGMESSATERQRTSTIGAAEGARQVAYAVLNCDSHHTCNTDQTGLGSVFHPESDS